MLMQKRNLWLLLTLLLVVGCSDNDNDSNNGNKEPDNQNSNEILVAETGSLQFQPEDFLNVLFNGELVNREDSERSKNVSPTITSLLGGVAKL